MENGVSNNRSPANCRIRQPVASPLPFRSRRGDAASRRAQSTAVGGRLEGKRGIGDFLRDSCSGVVLERRRRVGRLDGFGHGCAAHGSLGRLFRFQVETADTRRNTGVGHRNRDCLEPSIDMQALVESTRLIPIVPPPPVIRHASAAAKISTNDTSRQVNSHSDYWRFAATSSCWREGGASNLDAALTAPNSLQIQATAHAPRLDGVSSGIRTPAPTPPYARSEQSR